MRVLYLFILVVLVYTNSFTQNLVNNNAKIKVPNGVSLCIHSLYNSGVGGAFYYDNAMKVPGNWINDSPASFTQGNNGSLTLNGTGQQNIKSSGSEFGKLIVNNTSGSNTAINLQDNATIKENLTLTQGIVNTGSNTLIFNSTATSDIGSQNAFVDGKMKKLSSTSFTFPSGDIKIRNLEGSGNHEYKIWAPLAYSSSSASNVELEYFFDNEDLPDWWNTGSNMASTLHHVSDREYWRVNSDKDLNITLYWKNNTHVNNICPHGFDNGNVSDFVLSDLTIAYWSASMWKDAGGAATGDHGNGNIPNSSLVPVLNNSFVTFGSKENENPLPVILTNFTALCENNEVNISWETASETNNSGFYIESSLDGIKFKRLDFIQGAGNSRNMQSYSYTDKNYSTGNNYYRLVLEDFDKNEIFSKIIASNCKKEELGKPEFIIYPNPCKDVLNVFASNLKDNCAIISIYNSLGVELMKNKMEIVSHGIQTKFDVSSLPSAIYFVKISCQDFTLVKKLEIH